MTPQLSLECNTFYTVLVINVKGHFFLFNIMFFLFYMVCLQLYLFIITYYCDFIGCIVYKKKKKPHDIERKTIFSFLTYIYIFNTFCDY